MTQKPTRLSLDKALLDIYGRVRPTERDHHGPWVYVGSGDPIPGGTAPAFQNGWVNQGTGLVPMRFRWIHGGGLELQGSVTGGGVGTVVFTLPNDALYRPDYEIRITAVDDAGNLIVVRILANGNVIAGL